MARCRGRARAAPGLWFGTLLRTPQLWRYLTGESQELCDDCPELSALRDIVFTLKMLLAPHAEDLPPPAAYRVSDALLHWSSDKEGRLTVRGFGTHGSSRSG